MDDQRRGKRPSVQDGGRRVGGLHKQWRRSFAPLEESVCYTLGKSRSFKESVANGRAIETLLTEIDLLMVKNRNLNQTLFFAVFLFVYFRPHSARVERLEVVEQCKATPSPLCYVRITLLV